MIIVYYVLYSFHFFYNWEARLRKRCLMSELFWVDGLGLFFLLRGLGLAMFIAAFRKMLFKLCVARSILFCVWSMFSNINSPMLGSASGNSNCCKYWRSCIFVNLYLIGRGLVLTVLVVNAS
jgi:hypothetical protein